MKTLIQQHILIISFKIFLIPYYTGMKPLLHQYTFINFLIINIFPLIPRYLASSTSIHHENIFNIHNPLLPRHEAFSTSIQPIISLIIKLIPLLHRHETLSRLINPYKIFNNIINPSVTQA